MLAGAAHTRPGIEGSVLADRNSVGTQGMAVRHGFFRQILHHAIPVGMVELVHPCGVVGQLAGLSAFQHQNLKRRARSNFLRQCQPDKTSAGNHDINGLLLLHTASSMNKLPWRPTLSLWERARSASPTGRSLDKG